MSHRDTVTIHVRLLDEVVDTWRPVEAVHLNGDVYEIMSDSRLPAYEDEEWQFATGDVVRCTKRVFADGVQALVALERIPATS